MALAHPAAQTERVNDSLRERPLQPSTETSAPQTSRAGSRFVFLFGIVWCGFVGVFDYLTLRAFIPQVTSTWFVPADARILKSEFVSKTDSDGSSYGVQVEFTYRVNGDTYTSDRYKFGNFTSSDSKWARDAVRNFPPGSERTCYYDPQHPARAVLAQGIDGSDITLLMFLTPFNIVGAAFLLYPISTWLDRRRPKLVPPRLADRIRNREAYAMTAFTPLTTFIGAFFLTSFLGIFAVVIPSGFHPSLTKVVTIWSLALAFSITSTIIFYYRVRSGRYDLRIDHNSQIMSLPAMHKRPARETIPFSNIKTFDAIEVRTGSGEDEKISWEVKLHTNDNREFLLHCALGDANARRLAATLNASLNR